MSSATTKLLSPYSCTVIRALNEGEVSPVTRPSATRFIVVKRTYSLSIEENGVIEGEKSRGAYGVGLREFESPSRTKGFEYI